jgi:hypothetical protein
LTEEFKFGNGVYASRKTDVTKIPNAVITRK